MATGLIRANLNNGDNVTENEDLTFKIYGGLDGYTKPIATIGSVNSDANVSIDGNIVTIINVDFGEEETVKVTALDEASPANEAVLSPAMNVEEDVVVIEVNQMSFDASDPSNFELGTANEVLEWKNDADVNNTAGNITGANQPVYDPVKKAVVFSNGFDKILFDPIYIQRGASTWFCVYDTENTGTQLMHAWTDANSTLRSKGLKLKGDTSVDVSGIIPGGVTANFSNAQWSTGTLTGKVIMAFSSDAASGIETLHIYSVNGGYVTDTYSYTPTTPSNTMIDRIVNVNASSPLSLYHDEFVNELMTPDAIKTKMQALNIKHGFGMTDLSAF